MTDQITDAGAAGAEAPATPETTTATQAAASDDQSGGISLQLPDDGTDAGNAGAAPGADGAESTADPAKPEIPEGYVKVPGKDANDEEVAAYRTAIGVPETAEAYGEGLADTLKGIEGLPEEFAPAPWLAEMAHAEGLSVAAYQKIVKNDAESTAAYLKELKTAAEAERKESAKALKTKFGDTTAEKMTKGQRALNELGKQVDGFGDFMAKHGLDQHPKFIEFAMVLGERLGESAFADASGGKSQGRERDTAEVLYPNESRKG
ncbi:hypothetical protein [Rosistilla oblonga]|uniref:hypothetical protein n=1 Tax=Rosistilla oblonga TaxID=2527990 RepID=UPI003A976413